MKLIKILLHPYFWLSLIILFGFLVRLYKIDSPIADWHSWRQADTAAVTRNFVKEGFNPFIPKYDDMSGVAEKPVINPNRFRFVEFPIYNIAVYPFYLIFGVDDIYHRLVSIIFSLGSTGLIFFIVRKYASVFTGLVAAFAFALLPFNVFFSRTTLPEPTFVFFALGMIVFLDRWIWENKKILGITGFIFMAVAFLIKPYAIFFFLPLLYSVYSKRNNKKYWIKFMSISFLALLPFILWRLWILQQPEGIPASNWLFNGDGIRFRPAFWWWIISERIGREILGATGIVLFFIGLILKPKKRDYIQSLSEGEASQVRGSYFLHVWALSAFLDIIVIATGNVRHNYYQTLFVPVACIFFSLGFVQLLKGSNLFVPRIWTILLALLLFPLSFYFTFKIDKEFYNVNNPSIVEAGKVADKILPKDAIVLTPYNGDTAFLYQTNRPGFAVGVFPIKDLIADFGVNYYISTTKDDKTNWVMRHFFVLEDNPHYVIADLTKLKTPFQNSDPEP